MSQLPQMEQAGGSHLHRSRFEAVTSAGAVLNQQPLPEQAHNNDLSGSSPKQEISMGAGLNDPQHCRTTPESAEQKWEVHLNTGTGDHFLNITPVVQALRETINKGDLLKLKSFCKAKTWSTRQNGSL